MINAEIMYKFRIYQKSDPPLICQKNEDHGPVQAREINGKVLLICPTCEDRRPVPEYVLEELEAM